MEQLNHRYTIKDDKVYDADTQTELSQEEIWFMHNLLVERIVKLENRLKEKDELLKETLRVNEHLSRNLIRLEDELLECRNAKG